MKSGDQKGFIALTALLFMVLLSVAGISAITTATIEMQIAMNEKTHKQHLYFAESAAMEAIQMLDRADDSLLQNRSLPGWVEVSNPRIRNFSSMIDTWEPSNTNGDTFYAIIHRGEAVGESLNDKTNAVRHEFVVLGRSGSQGAQSIIEMGYWRRY